MWFSPLVDRIAGRGAGAWSIHMEAARLCDQGQDVIFLTVVDATIGVHKFLICSQTRSRCAPTDVALSPTGTPAAVQRLPGCQRLPG